MSAILPLQHPATERFDTPAILEKLAAASRQLAMRDFRTAAWQRKVGTASPQLAYPLAGMSNSLFVSRYQVQSRGKKAIAAFLHKAVQELGGGDE